MLYRVLLLCSVNVLAQTTVQAAMQASIEKQKASVRRQALGAVPQAILTAPSSWFTVPWDAPTPSAFPTPSSESVSSAAPLDCDPIADVQLTPMIRDAATREGVKEDLVRAVIQRESAFKPCAISPKGAQGLMQLMPG